MPPPSKKFTVLLTTISFLLVIFGVGLLIWAVTSCSSLYHLCQGTCTIFSQNEVCNSLAYQMHLGQAMSVLGLAGITWSLIRLWRHRKQDRQGSK